MGERTYCILVFLLSLRSLESGFHMIARIAEPFLPIAATMKTGFEYFPNMYTANCL